MDKRGSSFTIIIWVFFCLNLSAFSIPTRKDSSFRQYELLGIPDLWLSDFRSYEFFKKHFSKIDSLIATLENKAIADGDSLRVLSLAMRRGMLHEITGDENAAKEIYLGVVRERAYGKSKTVPTMNAYERLASIYLRKGKYDLALDCLTQALNLSDSLRDDDVLRNIHFSLARLHLHLNDSETAEIHFDLSTKYRTPHRHSHHLVFKLIEWASLNATKGNFGLVERLTRQADSIHLPKEPPIIVLYRTYALGLKSLHENNLLSAQHNLKKSMEVSIALNNPYYYANSLFGLSKVSFIRGDLRTSLDLVQQAIYVAKKNGYNEVLLASYYLSSEAFRFLGNHEAVIDNQKRYTELKESLYGEKLLLKISIMEAELKNRKDLNILNTQGQLIALHRKMYLQTRSITIGVTATVAMLMIALYIMSLINKRKKLINVALGDQFLARAQDLLNQETELKSMFLRTQAKIKHLQTDLHARLSTVQGLQYLSKRDSTFRGLKNGTDLELAQSDLKDRMKKLKQLAEELKLLKRES